MNLVIILHDLNLLFYKFCHEKQPHQNFGFIWYGNKKDEWWLKWLEDLPCSILFVDGNQDLPYKEYCLEKT